MPTPVIIPANLQWVGGAKETTYGTPVAAPTFWIPVDGSSLKFKPNQNVLTDDGFRGLMSKDFQQVAGMRFDTLDYKAYMYMDSMYQHFLALLGRADTVTGSADPWTHKTAVENGAGNATAQPPSFTLFYIDGATCWQIPGCIAADVKTTVKVDELATIDASWIGLKSTQITPPTNTPSTNKPIPSWNCTISLGGSALSVYSEVVIDLKRDAADVPTINQSQTPLAILGASVSSTINGTAVYQGGGSDVNIANYLNNTQQALTLKVAPVGDATHSLTIQQTVVAFDSAEPAGSNKWMEVAFTAKGLANATDALDSKQSVAQVIFLTTQSAAF